jgi:hypothetical protein
MAKAEESLAAVVGVHYIQSNPSYSPKYAKSPVSGIVENAIHPKRLVIQSFHAHADAH